MTLDVRVRLSTAVLALALAATTAGCAVLGRVRMGNLPPAAAIASVPEGASLEEVLRRLGAPLEYWLAPDGLLLIWCARQYDYDRLELDASGPLSVASLEPTIGALLQNLKLTLEKGRLREERVAVLFDLEGRVIAVAHRDGEGRRLR